jgi:uncharacterized protein (TIGR04255 family)
MERHQYANPPIEEAVCELRFEPGLEVDFSAPGRFYEMIRETYPGKPRHQQILSAEFQVGAEQTNPRMSMQQGVSKVLFPTEDGLRLIGLGQNLLSIHDLRPYSGWDKFRNRIEAGLKVFQQVDHPTGIRHIALRYINKIDLCKKKVKLGDYFLVGPQLPDSVPLNISGFFSRLETVYHDSPVRLLLTVASAPPRSPEEVAFLLDIEVKQEWADQSLAISEAMSHIEELRKRERDAFEAFITDQTREVFNVQ